MNVPLTGSPSSSRTTGRSGTIFPACTPSNHLTALSYRYLRISMPIFCGRDAAMW